MYWLRYPILVLILIPFVYADSAIQTDWSGGPGALEICTQWSDVFILEECIEWSTCAGSLTLERDDAIESQISDYVSYPGAVHAWDADNDGDQDICCLSGSGCSVRIFENLDNALGWEEHLVLNEIGYLNVVDTADIDQDGLSDLLIAAGWDGKGASDGYDYILAWVRNAGFTVPEWECIIIDEASYGYSGVCPADINGDGRVDVASASIYMDKISWWDNTGGTGYIWQEHIIANIDGAISVKTADFNGDGNTDVVCAAPQPPEGVIKVFLNSNGGGLIWHEVTVDPYYDGAQLAYPDDIDGDGDTDIVGLAYFDSSINWYENVNGSGGTEWITHLVGSGESSRNYNSLVTADLDGDGDTDIAGSGNNWWENTHGDGSEWVLHSIPGGGTAITTADVNGDGYMDLISSYRTSGMHGTLRSYDISRYNPAGYLDSQILYTQGDPYWDEMNWTGTTPANSSISFQVRASDDPENMGSWSGVITAPGSLAGILEDGDRYVQYRAILEASPCSSATAVLDQVQISWNPVSIEAENEPLEGIDAPLQVPSPCNGTISMICSLNSPSSVEIEIYDLAGRTILTDTRENKLAGLHTFHYIILENGIYFCRAITDDFNEVRSVVVLK